MWMCNVEVKSVVQISQISGISQIIIYDIPENGKVTIADSLIVKEMASAIATIPVASAFAYLYR